MNDPIQRQDVYPYTFGGGLAGIVLSAKTQDVPGQIRAMIAQLDAMIDRDRETVFATHLKVAKEFLIKASMNIPSNYGS